MCGKVTARIVQSHTDYVKEMGILLKNKAAHVSGFIKGLSRILIMCNHRGGKRSCCISNNAACKNGINFTGLKGNTRYG